MKTLDEIREEGNVYGTMVTECCGIKMLAGMIYDRHEKIYFTLGTNEEGWEHVAVHVGNGRRTPSWEVMCKAKATFWRDDEDVVQIHPKKSEYLHGIEGGNMEVLHLWRPVSGDWSELNTKSRWNDGEVSDER